MRIGVFGNPAQVTTEHVLARLGVLASELDLELALGRDLLGVAGAGEMSLEENWDKVDVLLTLGGDGTLLRGARLAGPRDIPVLGLNLGRLGFMTAAPVEQLEEVLTRLARGELTEQRRGTLDVEVRRDVDSSAAEMGPYWALNDAVVHKSGAARLITMCVWVDDQEVGQYSADGIVIASATGSTAYSLSASGPILVPTLDALVATPICPHTLAVRPLVLPGDCHITVQVLSRSEDVRLTIDGQQGSPLLPGDRVHARRSPNPVRLIRLPGQNFFSVLRHKLRWGDVRPRDL